jgi:hypothetical protein
MELPNPDDRLVGGVNCLARFEFETPIPAASKAFSALPAAVVKD